VPERLKEQTIRKHFLGRLSDEESERLEETIALDAGLFAKAKSVEMQIVDDYIRHSMSKSDRDAFENHYLSTDARRERLAASAALWQVANDDLSTERAVVYEQSLINVRGRGWWIALV